MKEKLKYKIEALHINDLLQQGYKQAQICKKLNLSLELVTHILNDRNKAYTSILTARDVPRFTKNKIFYIMYLHYQRAVPLYILRAYFRLSEWRMLKFKQYIITYSDQWNRYINTPTTMSDNKKIEAAIKKQAAKTNTHLGSYQLNEKMLIYGRIIINSILGNTDTREVKDQIRTYDGRKGLTISGPPGTGKTTLLRLVAEVATEAKHLLKVVPMRDIVDACIEAKSIQEGLRPYIKCHLCISDVGTENNHERRVTNIMGNQYVIFRELMLRRYEHFQSYRSVKTFIESNLTQSEIISLYDDDENRLSSRINEMLNKYELVFNDNDTNWRKL